MWQSAVTVLSGAELCKHGLCVWCTCSGDRGYTSSDGEALSSAARTQKRRRFEQRRRQHYDMKTALMQGRQLAQQELEDDYDDKGNSHEQRNVVSTNRVGSLRQQARLRADQQSQRQDRGQRRGSGGSFSELLDAAAGPVQ